MRSHFLARTGFVRMLAVLALALTGAQVLAQASGDPPGRVARLDHREGAVSFLPAGDDEWVDAPRNRPITRGDELWTDGGARAELHLGSTALRMNGRTHLRLAELDDNQARLGLPQGTVSLRVRQLYTGERLDIDTPNLVFRATQPGSYRLDVDPAQGSTRVTLHSGQGTVYGRDGQTLALTAPQQLIFSGRDLTQGGSAAAPVRDDFDEWAAARDLQEDQSVSGRYVSRETPGYQQLDPYGEWRQEPGYGPVWYPYVTVANWAPYRYGHWEYIPPWGWTWIDDAPWGFAPFHYGRWVLIKLHWCWVPGPIVARPVFAPALVAFVGVSSGHLSLKTGKPAVAWVPLAPGEPFRPSFHASRHFVDRINRHHQHHRDAPVFQHLRQPETVTVVPRDQFGRHRPMRSDGRAMAPAELERARVVAAPRFVPERRRNEDDIRRVPPDRIPPGWTAREHRIEGRADDRPRGRFDNRFDNRFGGREEDARRAGPLLREQAERQQRAEQEQAQRRQQALQDQQLRQQREQEQNLRREQAMREQAERQQRAMREREQAQRRQQAQQDQQLRQQREQEQNLRREQATREQAERQQRAMREQEQAQRRQQAMQDQQLRQQREQAQNLRREQATREQAERQQRAMREQEQAQRRQQAMQEQQLRQQREQGLLREQALREHAMREQAARQQRAMQEEVQRRQQAVQEQQLRQQRQHEEPRRIHGERRQQADEGRR